jgi:hypothetical protein
MIRGHPKLAPNLRVLYRAGLFFAETVLPFADRAVRRSILWPTRPLPGALRVSSRRWLLGKQEMAKARRAPLLVIGHPKSGNTWLRTMISRFYQVKYGLASDFVLKSDELHRLRPTIPCFFFSNGYYSYERVIATALDADRPDPELAAKPLLFIARHPCDLSVSWYFQFTRRISPAKAELIQADLARPVDRSNIDMWDFVMKSELGLANLIAFLNDWSARVRKLDNAHRTSYEAMRQAPDAAVKQFLELAGESYEESQVREAVDFASFENLQKLEASGRFKHGGMQKDAKGDPNARKVRRGKVGGYRDYFTPDQLEEMDALVARTLDPELGYGPVEAPKPVSA